MTETVEQKARRYLAEGRLTVTHLDGPLVRAVCRGSSETYRLGRSRTSPGGFCFCPSRSRCSHLIALALVTDSREDDDAPA